MSLINFVGIADNYPLPTVLTQINFAQGVVSAGTTVYKALLVGNLLSTGTGQVDGYMYGPDTAIALQTVQDAINLFGAGSELHIMYRDFVLRNPLTPLYACPVKESTGSKATLLLTITGTVSAAGTIRVFTPEGPIDTGFAVGDTLSTICTNIAANLNGNVNLPFTAGGGSGTVTLTAKQKGLRGNWLRAGIVIIGTSTGLTVTAPASGFMAAFTGGSTADTNANVITYLEGLGQRNYYIVSAAEDSTQVGAMASMVALQAAPAVGIRQRVIAASVDSLANVEVVSTAVNAPRVEILWLQNSDWCPSRLASCAAAVYSAMEASLGAPFSVNFNHFGADANTSGLWGVPAPKDGTSPSNTSKVSALNSGVTPIEVVPGGRTAILRRVTSYFLNGAVNDYRTRDASQVTICDFWADDVATAAALRFAGLVIGNDPAKGQSGLPTVVTPRQYRSLINEMLADYNNRGLLQNVADTIAGSVIVRETSPSTRISAQVPLQPIEILNQIGLLVNQNTPSQ